jgi:membrane peptidoglycan carboxypeptidase
MPLLGITRVVGASGSTVYEQKPGSQDGRRQVVKAAEAYLITDTLKDYARQWNLGWSRPMAGKSGTSGGTQVGVHPDSWMLAYSPDIVVGAWAGNTGANGAGQPTSAFGTDVGSTISSQFINNLPREYGNWYSQPSGISKTRSGEIALSGTENMCGGGAPAPGGSEKEKKKQPAATPAPSTGGGDEGD